LKEGIDRATRPESSWDNSLPFFDKRVLSLLELGKDIAVDKFHRTDNTLSKYYSLVEGAFKTVAFRDYIERWEKQNNSSYKTLEKNEKEMLFLKAANRANHAIFNYSEVNGIVKFLRRMPLGSPFLTFTYKAAPLMLESMLLNPIKFAKYATLPAVVTMIAQAAFDWDDDDIKSLRNQLPEYYRHNPGVAFMPIKDANGRPQIIPLDYIIPWNQIWHAASKSYSNLMKSEGEGIVGPGVLAAGTFVNEFGFLGGPLPSTIVALKTGKDDFTGRDIMTPGASPNTQLGEFMTYSFNQFLPAFIANGGYFKKLYQATATPNQNEFGEEISTPFQAVMGITGFQSKSVLEAQGRTSREKEYQSRLREISTLRVRIVKDRNVDVQDKISRIKELAQREKMVRTQMAEALK
jgi:hypothetical protein